MVLMRDGVRAHNHDGGYRRIWEAPAKLDHEVAPEALADIPREQAERALASKPCFSMTDEE